MHNNRSIAAEIVWRPSEEYINRSNLKKFMDQHMLSSFEELIAKSTSDIDWFTDAVLKFLNIEFTHPYTRVVDLTDGIQFPGWCIGGKLNIARNCVDKWGENPETADHIAIIWEGEDGATKSLTYKKLFEEVNRCANSLKSLGFAKGDPIGLYMPMIPEIVVALLAIAKIGAVVLPLFSGFGPQAIATRLLDANAKGLFTADGFSRRGKVISLKEPADKAIAEVPRVKHVMVFRNVGNDIEMKSGRDIWWHEIIPNQSSNAETEMTGAEDVLMILYTSGTSGKPKGTIHTHCGFPIKSAQDMAFGTDVQKGDIIYWMTDMGWMMGPWLVYGSLILGATCFLYDGAPDFPHSDRLWSLVERHKINVLGISPTLIRSLMTQGKEPVEKHDLSSISFFASTGEPWNPDPWMWLFEIVGKRKRPIINYSGGTEIGGGIVMGNPLIPLKPAAFSGPCPGIDADVVNEDGNSVRNEVGELVIKAPWIGMTRGFWHDRERYLDTYWSRWENTWVHGDWAKIDEDGLWYILGRSDDTIKVAGKRVGPAEVESVLVKHPLINEAAAIGVPHEIKGNEVVCFCVVIQNRKPDESLKNDLKKLVADEMGKPLAPGQIFFISDLPKTRNGKIMRRVIKKTFLGEDPGDISSLANPESINEISSNLI